MAKWRKCTLAPNGEPEFINLSNVAKIVPHRLGSLIILVGLPGHETIVQQTPSEVLGGEEIS